MKKPLTEKDFFAKQNSKRGQKWDSKLNAWNKTNEAKQFQKELYGIKY